MPEVTFSVRMPDGHVRECYSPSTVVRNYFKQDEEMAVADFLARSRLALAEASERVAAKYGYTCSSALGQLAEIEQFTLAFPQDDLVRIISI